jgi:hypothetical protein
MSRFKKLLGVHDPLPAEPTPLRVTVEAVGPLFRELLILSGKGHSAEDTVLRLAQGARWDNESGQWLASKDGFKR